MKTSLVLITAIINFTAITPVSADYADHVENSFDRKGAANWQNLTPEQRQKSK